MDIRARRIVRQASQLVETPSVKAALFEDSRGVFERMVEEALVRHPNATDADFARELAGLALKAELGRLKARRF